MDVPYRKKNLCVLGRSIEPFRANGTYHVIYKLGYLSLDHDGLVIDSTFTDRGNSLVNAYVFNQGQ